MDSIGFSQHDHGACISASISKVAQHCKDVGLQFTPVRKRVLELLLEKHRALGAYDILDLLRKEGLGSQPPVAYRALDFLVRIGSVHKIERLNAFIACTQPGEGHLPAFLICRICSSVAETHCELLVGALGSSARESGFQIECAVQEAEGICPLCQESQSE